MNSSDTGTWSARARSAMTITAPLRTPTSSDLAAGVVGIDLRGELGDLGGDLFLRDQHPLDVGVEVERLHGRGLHGLHGLHREQWCGHRNESLSYDPFCDQPPGQAHRSLAVPVGHQPLDLLHLPGAQIAGPGARRARPRGAAPGCGPRRAGPPAAATSSGCPDNRSAQPSSASASSRSRSAVRASASATPGPSASSSTGSAALRTRARAKAGSSLCGSSHGGQVECAAGGRGGRPPHAEQRPDQRPRRGRHAGQRASPRAPRQPEQHGLGLVVEGVAEQDPARAQPLGRRVEGGVPGVPGRGFGAAGRRRRAPWPPRPARVRAPGTPTATASARAAEPGCSPWSTVTAPARSPQRGASSAVAAARASESAPPLTATRTRSPASTSTRAVRTASRVAATAGSIRMLAPGLRR